MTTYWPEGNGQTSSEELARYSLAQQEARQRAQEGLKLARGLSGSRDARQALGERMAAATRGNNADDRINGGRGGHARATAPAPLGYPAIYPPTY